MTEEQLRQEAEMYTQSVFLDFDECGYSTEGFIQGAKWANTEMLNKACKWLYYRVNTPYFTYTDREEIIKDFRKFMEE